MKFSVRSVLPASGLLALILGLVTFSLQGESEPETPTPGVPEAAAAPRSLAAPSDPAYETAATDLRQRRCDAAQDALAPLLSASGERGRFARLVSGFYAHACEDVALASERLSAAAEPGGPLEDWRLLLLAESAYAAGRPETAARAQDELLADHRDSPLWPRALVAAIERSADSGQAAHAVDLVRWSRSQKELSPETIGEIEAVAWRVGQERQDLTVQAHAARRLLIYAPLTAAELGVVELFRRPDGSVAWRAILTGDEIERRARALLDDDLADDALATLGEVPGNERDLSWALLRARALTESARAREALAVLDQARPADAGERTDVEWARARAYADLAEPLASGARLSVAQRRRMRRASHDHDSEVVRLGADPALAGRALRRLFADYAADDQFDAAVEALHAVRMLDPEDTTGASYLWGLGWKQYQQANFSGAVGDWSELASLYPESPDARSGRYWTARAFDRLGQRDRARAILEEIAAADTTDFYRRHALARLGSAGGDGGAARGAAGEAPAEQPWPVDPDLARARLLTDLGLDDLALAEIEARGDSVDRRAREALTGLALSRLGKRRAGIPHLRRAFPALGGPYQASVPVAVRRLYYPLAFEDAIRAAARSSGVPTPLLFGIVRKESAFDLTATSHAGARGLMQLMPATGREVARKLGLPYSSTRLEEPAYNVRLGAAYFRQVMEMFDDRTELALAGYNGGPYRVKRLWRKAGPGAEVDYFLENLPVEESRDYAKRVLLYSDSYEQLYSF